MRLGALIETVDKNRFSGTKLVAPVETIANTEPKVPLVYDSALGPADRQVR